MCQHEWNSEPHVVDFLVSLVKMCDVKTVLEVGTFEGNTSAALAEAIPKGGYFVTIDIENYLTEANRNRLTEAGKDRVVDIVLGDSLKEMPKFTKRHFDLVYIDGNHEFEHVLREFKIAENLINRNGMIALHDSFALYDVKRVVEYAANYGYTYINLYTPEGRGLAILMRK